MKEPIIITAFWDVGRSKNCEIPRSNSRYYQEFAEWARIRNQLIVYTDEKSKKIISDIRKKYGLEDKTIIIETDIFTIESDLYKKMEKVELNKSFLEFRYRPEAMENKARFDYAWFMKYWCLSDASNYVKQDDVLAWFDFGFNHLNRCYSNMKEFDFTWILNRNVSKVQVFSLTDVDSYEIIDVLQFMKDSIMGVFMLVEAGYANEFWNVIKQAMNSLLMIGCMDDDQVLVLMAYKWRPDLIHVNVSEWWYLPLKECGATDLSVTYNKEKDSIKHVLWSKFYSISHKIKYLYHTYFRMKTKVDS